MRTIYFFERNKKPYSYVIGSKLYNYYPAVFYTSDEKPARYAKYMSKYSPLDFVS